MQDLPLVLGQLHPALGHLLGVPLYVFLLVVALSGTFLIGYLIQGMRFGWQLWSVVRGVRRLSTSKKQVLPKDVAELLTRQPFKRLWIEYADALHPLRRASSSAATLTEYRASMPAEVFFMRDVLVDSRMFDDFVRNLPGC